MEKFRIGDKVELRTLFWNNKPVSYGWTKGVVKAVHYERDAYDIKINDPITVGSEFHIAASGKDLKHLSDW